MIDGDRGGDDSVDPTCVFQILSARRTVDLKTPRVDVNQGFDLEVRFESLDITGACLSSSED